MSNLSRLTESLSLPTAARVASPVNTSITCLALSAGLPPVPANTPVKVFMRASLFGIRNASSFVLSNARVPTSEAALYLNSDPRPKKLPANRSRPLRADPIADPIADVAAETGPLPHLSPAPFGSTSSIFNDTTATAPLRRRPPTLGELPNPLASRTA